MVDKDQSTEVEEDLEQDDDLEQDALDAFSEATGKEKDEPDETKDDEDNEDSEDKEDSEDTEDDSGDDAADKETGDAPDEPAKAAVDKRLKDLGLEDDTQSEGDDDKSTDKEDGKDKADTKAQEKEGAKEEKPPASKAPSLTKEAVYDYFDVVDGLGLPDKPIVIGDREIDLKEFQADFPEHFNTTVVIAGAMVKEALAKMEKPADNSDQVKSLEETVEGQGALIGEILYHEALDDELEKQGHEGVRTRKLKNTKEFQDWLGSQSKGVNKLAESSEIEDGALVVGLYLEQTAKKKADKLDAEARDKKKRQTDIHSSTMRSSGNKEKTKGAAKDDESEARDAFDEATKKKD